MKLHSILFALFLTVVPTILCGQSLDDAKKWYQEGNYAEAKPVFEAEYLTNPDNAALNQWLGVIALSEGSWLKAQKHLEFASQKNISEANLFLGELYVKMYRFADAEKEFAKYQRTNRRNKANLEKLVPLREYADKLQRLIRRTEDIQIIDSVVVAKSDFLSAYKLSQSAGSLQPVSQFFGNRTDDDAVLYQNERKDKIYYSQGDSISGKDLYSMEKLLDVFGNEKRLSESVNRDGSQAYPFVMPDGVTIYFSSTGHGSLGGYDLFVTRYNLATDAYLTPNQLNMPFNSPFNDYMMAIDEEKGIGWFASDRFQPEDTVCVYTFIPASAVTLLENEDEDYLAQRARISSISDTWQDGADYFGLLQMLNAESVSEKSFARDFEFVINDKNTYYTLSDFKDREARNLFAQAIDLAKKLEEVEKDLDENRDRAANSPEMSSTLKSRILALEKEAESLHNQVESLRFRARNQEIRNNYY